MAVENVDNNQRGTIEEHGLVWREIFPDEPQRVDYRLTPFGKSLKPLWSLLEEWGQHHAESFRRDSFLARQSCAIQPGGDYSPDAGLFLRVLASETEKWRRSHGFTGVRRWDLRRMIVYGK